MSLIVINIIIITIILSFNSCNSGQPRLARTRYLWARLLPCFFMVGFLNKLKTSALLTPSSQLPWAGHPPLRVPPLGQQLYRYWQECEVYCKNKEIVRHTTQQNALTPCNCFIVLCNFMHNPTNDKGWQLILLQYLANQIQLIGTDEAIISVNFIPVVTTLFLLGLKF